jgi:putative PIN family toxin of toxin-antitoxin system
VRVVLDPNVLVSGLIGKATSAPRLILDALDQEEIEVVLSEDALAELAQVLHRPKLSNRVTRSERDEYLARLRVQAEVVDDPGGSSGATRDPDDDYLVALARRARADAIVSGDKDLVQAGLEEPPVWTPRECADRLRTASAD